MHTVLQARRPDNGPARGARHSRAARKAKAYARGARLSRAKCDCDAPTAEQGSLGQASKATFLTRNRISEGRAKLCGSSTRSKTLGHNSRRHTTWTGKRCTLESSVMTKLQHARQSLPEQCAEVALRKEERGNRCRVRGRGTSLRDEVHSSRGPETKLQHEELASQLQHAKAKLKLEE
jgi:hypothetical protein